MRFSASFFLPRISLYVIVAAIILLWIPSSSTQSVVSLEKPRAPRARFVPGEVLVRFRSESQAKLVRQVHTLQVEGRGIPLKIEEVEASHLLAGLRLARVNPSETLAAVKALAARPDVLYAEPNYARERFAAPNDPLYANLWGLKNTGTIFGTPGSFLPGFDIDAEEAWNITTGSRDVVVGIVDGGVDRDHTD